MHFLLSIFLWKLSLLSKLYFDPPCVLALLQLSGLSYLSCLFPQLIPFRSSFFQGSSSWLLFCFLMRLASRVASDTNWARLSFHNLLLLSALLTFAPLVKVYQCLFSIAHLEIDYRLKYDFSVRYLFLCYLRMVEQAWLRILFLCPYRTAPSSVLIFWPVNTSDWFRWIARWVRLINVYYLDYPFCLVEKWSFSGCQQLTRQHTFLSNSLA